MNTSARIGIVTVVGEDMKKVTKNEKKAWMSRGLDRKREYYKLCREHRARLETAAKCTPSYGGIVVAGSSNPHKFERVAMIHDDIEENLNEIERIRREIKKAIITLKVPADAKIKPETVEGMKNVLFERYVNFREFKDIAPKYNYSEGHVYVLHRQGLEHIRISRTMIERSKAKKKKTH